MELRLVVLALLSTTVRGGGRFELRLKEFYNNRGYEATSNYCDPNILGGKTSDCDPSFKLSFNLNRDKYYPAIQTKQYVDTNTVKFGSDLGPSLTNPIRRTFTRWPGSLSLQVTVMDIDDGSADDLIDSFSTTVKPPIDGKEHSYTLRGKQGNHTHLQFSIKVTCDDHYYPPQCTKYCLAQHSGSCRYNCDSNGDKQCLRGWRSPSTGCCQCFCYNDGNCTPTTDSFRCSCPAGWTGDLCQDDVDECRTSSNLCKNGGTCENTLGSFICKCPPGFKGKNCEQDVNECKEKLSVCKNGGTCTNTAGSFTCICPSNFTGKTCVDDVDECRITLPVCKNSGTCENTYGSFTCSCRKGFIGKTCHLDVDECRIRPPVCKNSGSCTNLIGSFSCTCPKTFTGNTCDEDVDECKIRPPVCKNSGKCTNDFGSFRCSCPTEFTGKTCELDVDECSLTPPICKNNGTCQNTHGSFLCSCSAPFSGRYCDTDVDECKMEQPVCKNGGVCENNFGGFTCNCTADYTGKTCHMKVGEPSTQNWKAIIPSIVAPLLAIIIIIVIVIIFIVRKHRNTQTNAQRDRSMSYTSQTVLQQNANHCPEEDPYYSQDGGYNTVYDDLGAPGSYPFSSRMLGTTTNGDTMAPHKDGAARFSSDGGYKNPLMTSDADDDDTNRPYSEIRADDGYDDCDIYSPYSEAGDEYDRIGSLCSRRQSEVNDNEEVLGASKVLHGRREVSVTMEGPPSPLRSQATPRESESNV